MLGEIERLESLGPQLLGVMLLVLQSPLTQYLHEGIHPTRRLTLSECNCEIKPRTVSAPEKPQDVRRGQYQV